MANWRRLPGTENRMLAEIMYLNMLDHCTLLQSCSQAEVTRFPAEVLTDWAVEIVSCCSLTLEFPVITPNTMFFCCLTPAWKALLTFARVSVLHVSVFITPNFAKWKLPEIHSRDSYFYGRHLAVDLPFETRRTHVLLVANDTQSSDVALTT